MYKMQDVNVESIRELPAPGELKKEIPITERAAQTVFEAREGIKAILDKNDSRTLVVVGPCSIHDEQVALEYARNLAPYALSMRDKFLMVMRAYFEKPRTTLGWEGLVYDPYLDGSCALDDGLRVARKIALGIADCGLPVGTEVLDSGIIRYYSDLISWGAIGARTSESQPHRAAASGLSFPIGFKNGTSGDVDKAMNAMVAARHKHTFLGVSDAGRQAAVRSKGNEYAHLILRGGDKAPNYDRDSIRSIQQELAKRKLRKTIIVDCSHGNSGKDPCRQKNVVESIVAQRSSGNTDIVGFMIESNLFTGRQDIPIDLSELKYGVSVTDGCLGWEETKQLLEFAYSELKR